MKEYLSMFIKYQFIGDHFEVWGDIQQEERLKLVEDFLRTQEDAKKDLRKPASRASYLIELRLFPYEKDRIEAHSDTGSKGLSKIVLLRLSEKMRNDKQNKNIY